MNASSEQIEVLVLNLNGREHLETCLGSLRRSAHPGARTVLLDNGSTDGSQQLVRERFPEVELVEYGRNLGFAGAYARAFEERGAELLVLLNNDTEVAPGWLEPLRSAMAEDSSVAIAGARMMHFDRRDRVDHAGGRINPLGGGIDLLKGRPFPRDHSQLPYDTGFACGGALMVRRLVALAVGGFDPEYTIYHEDVELAWKCWLAGYRVLAVPASVVYHKGGAHMGSMETPRRLFLSQRNRWRNLLKHAGSRRLAIGLLSGAVFDLLRSAKFALERRPDAITAMLRADAEVLRELPLLLAKRRAARAKRRRSDRELEILGVFHPLTEGVREYLFLSGGTSAPP